MVEYYASLPPPSLLFLNYQVTNRFICGTNKARVRVLFCVPKGCAINSERLYMVAPNPERARRAWLLCQENIFPFAAHTGI